MPIEVAVDTSFLMFMARRKVPIGMLYDVMDRPIRLYTSKGVVHELETLSRSARSTSQYAGLALMLLKRSGIKVTSNTGNPDDWLLTRPLIATTDMRLARKAHAKGIRVISITKSNRVVIK